MCQKISCYGKQKLMPSLTEVAPHPVTTTLVPTGTVLFSKAMGRGTLLKLKGGFT